MKNQLKNNALVYSTEAGRMCPACRQPTAQCRCRATPVRAPTDGVVRVSTQTKGRAGKAVTLVRGLALDELALAALGKQLRTACGAGGTIKNGIIEVQGDHCERIMEALKGQGYVVKRSGG